MAVFSETCVKGLPASVAGLKGTAVKLTAGLVVVATAATDAIIGVLDVDHDAGQQANVRLRSASGTAVGRAGGNVAVGDKVTATAGGELITTVTAGNETVGIALEAAVNDGYFEFMPCTGKV